MSGGGGGVIIIHTSKVLGDPLVHGQLPDHLKRLIDPVLAKPEGQWTDCDKIVAAHVYSWALCNLK